MIDAYLGMHHDLDLGDVGDTEELAEDLEVELGAEDEPDGR